MTRNLKLLGLALIAVFATSAVTTSVASADTFTTEGGVSVFVTGKQTGAGDVLTTTAGTAKCKEIIYAGAGIPSGSTTFSIFPNYPEKTGGVQNCTAFGFPAVVNPNGCTFLFHIGAATTGTMDIVCAAGKEFTITASAGLTTKCVVHIPAQTGLGTITYKNSGSGSTREVEIAINISTLKYAHTSAKAEASGLGSCTAGSATNGSYVGSFNLTGETSGGTHIGIFLV
jgi:hypothetical protein